MAKSAKKGVKKGAKAGNPPSPKGANGENKGKGAGGEGRVAKGGRDPQTGRFVKGYKGGPGNPRAKQTADTRRLLLEMVPEHMDDILMALIVKAKTGDIAAIKEVLDRTMGKPRQGIDLDAEVKTTPSLDFAAMSDLEIAHVIREGGLELPPGLERKIQLIEAQAES